MLQIPAVGNLVLPADIPGILPQQTDLMVGVSCVPQGVPQMLSGACFGFHSLVRRKPQPNEKPWGKWDTKYVGEGKTIPNNSICHLKLNAGLSHSPEGSCLPIGLLCLLPHHHVKGGGVLVAKDEACIVIIGDGVHVKRPFKVDSAESRVPWNQNQLS